MIKVWGCLANVLVFLAKRIKLSLKIINCIFIGFSNNSVVYKFLVYKYEIYNIHVNTILESIDVEFF